MELSEETVLPTNQIVDYCTKGGKIFTPIPVEIRRNPLAAVGKLIEHPLELLIEIVHFEYSDYKSFLIVLIKQAFVG